MNERINIKWTPGFPSGHKAAVRSQRGLKKVSGYGRIEEELGWEVCELPPGLAKKEIEWLEKHPNVLAVEPEGFGSLIQPVQVDIVAPAGDVGAAQGVAEGTEWWQKFIKLADAWTVTRGLGSIGAITDNGLGLHPFTDSHLVETKIFDSAETDPWGGSHGNPVTGCEVGTAPDCGVTNYKIAGSDNRCSWNDVANAWLHAKAMGRKVVNTSWGGGSSILAAQAAATCKQAGVAIVCAAGNSSDATQFPASNVNCYAVSALDEAGGIAGFSCRGKIDISAPGVSLLTTTSGGGWAHFSGTSGAAPIVSGILLLILARNPSWTGVQAMQHLLLCATPKLPVEHYGAGHANAAKAVGAVETTPEPPTPPPPTPPPPTSMTDTNPPSKTAQPTISEKTSGGFRATWVAAQDNVGVVKHRLYLDTVAVKDVDMPGLTWLFSELVGGRTYIVQLRGVDAAGNQGPHSDPLHVTLPVGTTPPPPPPPPEEPELSTSTLSALVVIENDIPSYTRAIDRVELKNQLNRLAAML